MKLKPRILVAPLNWGLGHAARCIPLINALIDHDFEPIIASDGNSLTLLKKEFPNLTSLPLPSYNIKYSKKGNLFKLKVLINTPRILKAIKAEKKVVNEIVSQYDIKGIISDNRMGVYSKKVPSAYITHQLNVLSGTTTWLTSETHKRFINKFDACWIPDVEKEPSLSGKLGHNSKLKTPVRYLGAISRFKKTESDFLFDLLVILSGPEPQRTMLEQKILKELNNYNKKVLLVRGVFDTLKVTSPSENISIVNYLTSEVLETSINQSKLVLSRSGYTTIMDLAKLGKPAFFIPTPGQFEQEYLAKRLDTKRIAPYCTQDTFNIDELNRIDSYSGFKVIESRTDYGALISLFKCK